MQNSFKKTACLFALAASLSSCCGVDMKEYAGKEPIITVQSFYSKPIEGYGFFQDRSGKVTDRYYATLVPQWSGNEGTIVEKQWNDKGQLFLEQEWKLHVSENGRDFSATATRIDGKVKGEVSGFAMHMTYTLIAPTKSGGNINLSADDWTYLQPDGHGINKVAVSKFGFHVGDITYDLHPVAKGQALREGYPGISQNK